MNKCTVVIPVFNEDVKNVTKTYCELKMQGFEVIIVDDGSNMDFPEELNVISYPANIGYGYALKQGIKKAETPFIITMDGDGEHTSSDAQKLYTVFNLIDDCDMLVGCRWSVNEKPIRWIGRKAINFLASLWSRHFMVDLNSGMRMFKREIAVGYEPILCDTFSFTTSLTVAMTADNYKVAWFPINVQRRYSGKSNVNLIKDGFITVFYIFWIGFALRTRRIRAWLRSMWKPILVEGRKET